MVKIKIKIREKKDKIKKNKIKLTVLASQLEILNRTTKTPKPSKFGISNFPVRY